jgi:CBS domain-containing protein
MSGYETLLIHALERDGERDLAVACPQRVGPVPITQCVMCELCGGLDVDPKSGLSGVRCDVAGAATPGVQPTKTGARNTPIASIMTENVVSVSPDTTLENIEWLMVDRRIGAVPVLDERGRPLGIVSKLDILRDRSHGTFEVDAVPRDATDPELTSERALTGLCARDVMTPILYVVPERASIAHVAASMVDRHVHHLLVIGDGGALRGIVSSLDLVRWLAASARFE